ncbi:hypothetical protein C8J56DRAFT_1163596, partial [Mycena floridula]
MADKALRAALITFRASLVDEILGVGSFLPPQTLMPTELLERIVDLAHYKKITTVTELQNQTDWGFSISHGSQVVALIHQFHSLPSESPTTALPLQQVLVTPGNGTEPRCHGCGKLGHK